jgi:predicted SAM-dependent methyltransferase
MAEHVWEHLTDDHTAKANKNCYDFLETGGTLRIAVPDGNHPDKDYIEWVRVGGSGDGADDHKILYTYDVMKQRLEKVGFTVQLLEYWDESGQFHYTDWTDDNGLIRRSRRYDERNAGGQLKYTSLIVDAIRK